MKFSRTILSALVVAAAAASGAVADQPQTHGRPNLITGDPGGFVKSTGGLFEWAAPLTSIGAGQTVTITKNHSLHCSVTTGCVALVQASVQVAPDSTSANVWTVCAYVDGQVLDPKECFVVDTDSENVATISYQGTTSVKKGNHSIKLTVESNSVAGFIFTWHMSEQMLP